jgi:DNA-binding response OmpR family regulator
MRLLVVEDEEPIADALARTLRRSGYAVDVAHDGRQALRAASDADYDAVILDLNLPQIDGMVVAREIRAGQPDCYILMATARTSVDDRVRGLDAGADDYLTKPFELEELLARLRALVRRTHQVKSPVMKIHDLEIDTAARTVKRNGKAIHLTPREYALLQFLAFHRGKVVSRSMIWEHLYDEHDENTSNVVDVYIRYLRNKLDKDHDPPLILTRWGEGYMLRGEEES